ncbi:sugar kinase [Herbaspirillum lusitanum]|uniref:Sugar kinase n=1 Tax=Herbaspirillum lusitanum TaxID=213312 RepID=A0ABW9A962_9BURK
MNNDKAFDIIAIGEPMIEFNETSAGQYRQGFGGDTSNFAIAAARQGARVAYCTRIGDDRFGRMLQALWGREGVAMQGVEIDAEAHTGMYFVSHDEAGHHFHYMRAGSAASRMHPKRLPQTLLTQCRYLHVSGISQAISANACDAVFAAIDIARQAGARICYDPNLRLNLWPLTRARAIIEQTIASTDIFLPGLDEAQIIAGVSTRDDVLAWCEHHGAQQVVLKCGADGAWIWQKGVAGARHVPPTKVSAIDATGAGDCFDGSLISRLVAGDSIDDAVRYANVAAGLSTTGYGAIEPIPTKETVLKHLSVN